MSFLRVIFGKIPLAELVSPAVKLLRKSQCESCEYYQPKFGTCGPAIVGKTIDRDGEKVYLCGCIINEKAELKNQHCPIKKW